MTREGLATAAFGASSDHAREALSEPLLDATAAAELLAVRPSTASANVCPVDDSA